MTILARVVRPDYELTVCGDPSAAWIEWVRTTRAPLTAGQMQWRHIAEHRARRLAELTYPRKSGAPEACPHRDTCDRCLLCELCTCECHEPILPAALDLYERNDGEHDDLNPVA